MVSVATATDEGAQEQVAGLVGAQEAERARIARELHDSVGQKIALLQIELDRVARALPPNEQRQLRDLSLHIAEIARDLHDVSYRLHPMRLEILGLERSIEALCNESARQSGITIAFSSDRPLPQRIGSSASLCVYRVAQEALHNVVKHSNAARADVQLSWSRGVLTLVVADGGQGFDSSTAHDGLGLTSMRQRVELLNGDFAVRTRRGRGTRIRVRIRLRGDPA